MRSKIKAFHGHSTRREVLYKFLLLFSIVVLYFSYLSWKYGIQRGAIVSALTWSFFVLCTPVADAGFLLDFPIRLLFNIKMVITEIVVWIIALILNFLTLTISPLSYETTFLTRLFHEILTTPYPYWSIIILCGLGTFLSIHFGDEMIDVFKHSDREKYHKHGFSYKLLITLSLFILIMFSYYYLLESLGIDSESIF